MKGVHLVAGAVVAGWLGGWVAGWAKRLGGRKAKGTRERVCTRTHT